MGNYPKQLYAVQRKEQTLGVDFEVGITSENDKYLESFADYSCLKFTLVDKRQGKKIFPTANIKPQMIKALKEDTTFIRQKSMFLDAAVKSQQDQSATSKKLYYSTICPYFKTSYAGKTIAEIVKESGGEKALSDAVPILNKNAEKYPINKKYVDTIQQALKDKDIIDLTKNESSSPLVYLLKMEQMKFKRTKRNGKNLCYKINIFFDSSKKAPFVIELSNCYAPVNKGIEISLSEAEDWVNSSISLGIDEWSAMINHLDAMVDSFRTWSFGGLYQKALADFEHNMANGRSKPTAKLTLHGTITSGKRGEISLQTDRGALSVLLPDNIAMDHNRILKIGNLVTMEYKVLEINGQKKVQALAFT